MRVVTAGIVVWLATPGTGWGQPALVGAPGSRETVKKEDVKTWTITIDGRQYSVRPATPSYDGDTGLFRLSSAYTLPKGKVAVSLFRDNYDRDPKDIDFSVHGANLAVGVTRKLELFGHFGLQNRIDTDALGQTGFANDYPFAGTSTTSAGWQTGVGDVKLGAKLKLLDDYRGDGVGLAIKGVLKLGTADEAKGLGTGKPSFAADLAISKTIHNNADLHGSVGYEVNSDPDSVDLANAFRWGLGLNVPSCRYFQLQAELTGKVYAAALPKQTNTVDLIVGPVFWIKPGIFIRPALSKALRFDDRGLGSGGASSVGRQITIGYHPGTACCEVYTPPPPEPPKANRLPTVQCETERSTLLPGETTRCRATGSDPDGDQLTYSWTAGAGHVSSSGAEATFDSTGVASDSTVNVTVTTNDGRGGTASSTCRVTIQAPARRPEALSRTVSGFPPGSASTENVDKAELEDVSVRLGADPGSAGVLIGHADAREARPDALGRARAEAVKEYLVKQRAADASRITTHSAGASQPLPLEPGISAVQARSRNRRVDVVFVPTGVEPPEWPPSPELGQPYQLSQTAQPVETFSGTMAACQPGEIVKRITAVATQAGCRAQALPRVAQAAPGQTLVVDCLCGDRNGVPVRAELVFLAELTLGSAWTLSYHASDYSLGSAGGERYADRNRTCLAAPTKDLGGFFLDLRKLVKDYKVRCAP